LPCLCCPCHNSHVTTPRGSEPTDWALAWRNHMYILSCHFSHCYCCPDSNNLTVTKSLLLMKFLCIHGFDLACLSANCTEYGMLQTHPNMNFCFKSRGWVCMGLDPRNDLASRHK